MCGLGDKPAVMFGNSYMRGLNLSFFRRSSVLSLAAFWALCMAASSTTYLSSSARVLEVLSVNHIPGDSFQEDWHLIS